MVVYSVTVRAEGLGVSCGAVKCTKALPGIVIVSALNTYKHTHMNVDLPNIRIS